MSNVRTFTTRYRSLDEPVWEPLAAVSRLVRSTPDLPDFHPGEFMWMACVENRRKRLVIHLYKHYDTRCYLNLDEAGHAYEFFYYDDERDDRDRQHDRDFSGRYRLHRTLEFALHRLGLWQFEYGRLERSFPPSEWPLDPDDLAPGAFRSGRRWAWIHGGSDDVDDVDDAG